MAVFHSVFKFQTFGLQFDLSNRKYLKDSTESEGSPKQPNLIVILSYVPLYFVFTLEEEWELSAVSQNLRVFHMDTVSLPIL
jgi:hypothetical protein